MRRRLEIVSKCVIAQPSRNLGISCESYRKQSVSSKVRFLFVHLSCMNLVHKLHLTLYDWLLSRPVTTAPPSWKRRYSSLFLLYAGSQGVYKTGNRISHLWRVILVCNKFMIQHNTHVLTGSKPGLGIFLPRVLCIVFVTDSKPMLMQQWHGIN